MIGERAPDPVAAGAVDGAGPDQSRAGRIGQSNIPQEIAAQASLIDAERAALLRDFVFEALAHVEGDTGAARLCLANDDDVGTRYHLKRVVECVKAAATTFRELEALTRSAADMGRS